MTAQTTLSGDGRAERRECEYQEDCTNKATHLVKLYDYEDGYKEQIACDRCTDLFLSPSWTDVEQARELKPSERWVSATVRESDGGSR